MQKQRLSTVLLIASVLPWLSGWVSSSVRPEPRAWGLRQWIAWRNARISDLLAPTTFAGHGRALRRTDVVAKCGRVFGFLEPMLNDGSLLKNKARRRALGNFVKFVVAEHRMGIKDAHGESTQALAMDIPDRGYWSFAKPWLTFPALLRGQPFLRRLSASETYAAAVQMIRVQNLRLPSDRKWITTMFRAQFIPSVDKATYGRLLVMIPNQPVGAGRVLDSWISFAIETPDSALASEIKSVSEISVVRDPASPGTHEAFFADFMREPQSDGTITINPNFLMAHNPSKNCFDCHKAGVLPIFPKLAYTFDSKGKLVQEPSDRSSSVALLNAMIPKYGAVSFGHLDPNAYGPSIGPFGLKRTDASIRAAAQGIPLPSKSCARIREAMACGRCHEPSAKINYPLAVQTDRDATVFEGGVGMLQTMIRKGYMPPGNNLTPAERRALVKALLNEYLDLNTGTGVFVNWLKGA